MRLHGCILPAAWYKNIILNACVLCMHGIAWIRKYVSWSSLHLHILVYPKIISQCGMIYHCRYLLLLLLLLVTGFTRPAFLYNTWQKFLLCTAHIDRPFWRFNNIYLPIYWEFRLNVQYYKILYCYKNIRRIFVVKECKRLFYYYYKWYNVQFGRSCLSMSSKISNSTRVPIVLSYLCAQRLISYGLKFSFSYVFE